MVETQRFPYLSSRNARGEISARPMLPIALMLSGMRLDVVGLVDSGADVNVLPFSVGLQLGSVWEEQRTSLELSGNLANYEARGLIVTAHVGRFPPVRLAFAWTRAENALLLLGQVNFFAEFDVCFFRSQGVFEISRKAD